MALSEELSADLQVLLDATANPLLDWRWRYYTGEHPKMYVTPKLRETFKALADSFDENYCGLAVNSRLSRLEVVGWEGPGAQAAQDVWDRSKLPRRQSRLWRYALVHASACLIVDVADGEDPKFAINPATIAYGHPDPDNPEALLWVGKVWASTGGWRASIMYPQETVRMTYAGKDRPTGTMNWVLDPDDPTAPNPLGDTTPGVVFSPYDEAQPLIDSITGLQNRINKLAANKFVASEFGAFRQRVFFTRQAVTPFDLKNAPDEAIILDPGDDGEARVQELTATELANYDRAKDAEVDALFTIATLPRHMRVNPGAPPSGEAIKADEGPFVECLKDLQNQLGETLTEAMLLLGIEADPVWRDPSVHNDLTNAQTVQAFVDAGFPLDPLMVRYAGWSDDEVAEAREAAPVTTTADTVGAALLGAFNSPGVVPPEPTPAPTV